MPMPMLAANGATASSAVSAAAVAPCLARPQGSPTLERSRGRVEIAFKQRGPVTALAHLHQAGCGKARLPRPLDAAHPEAVLINLAGGVPGGDRLDWRVTWRAGSSATVSGQAAEKIYRASGMTAAVIETGLTVEAGATGLWLPQETILFDRARLVRRNRFRVAAGGRLLALEAVILGRQAMGETVTAGLLDETFEVRYGDRLLLLDRQRFRGRIDALLSRRAVADGARALVSLLYVGEAAAAGLGAVREALGEAPAAATAPDPNLILVRWLEAEPAGLRADLVAALSALQTVLGLPRHVPRVWCC